MDSPDYDRDDGKRLERIIGNLLELARLEGGGSTMRREFVDIRALFARVAARQRELDERTIRASHTARIAAPSPK